jgi:hypothetical protein
MNCPVWRLWKVQERTTVSSSAMTWWISQRRSENAAWSTRMDQAMPSSPGGAPGGPSWSTRLGWMTSANAAPPETLRSLRHHEVAGVLDHVQRPAVADAGLSGPGWHLVEEVVFRAGVITQ